MLDPTCATTTVPGSPDPLLAATIPVDETENTGPTDETETGQGT